MCSALQVLEGWEDFTALVQKISVRMPVAVLRVIAGSSGADGKGNSHSDRDN